MRIASITFAVLFGLAATGNAALVQAQDGSSDEPGVAAVRVAGPVDIDGRLDEAAWQEAEVVSAFRQYEPVEGAPGTQLTEVRVLYGPGNLYIGAFLYDEDPAGIEQALGRRDDYNRADWFLVSIDSYFDRKTAYTFGVNAAGVQYDALRSGSGGGPGGGPEGMDESWDAIWYSAARMTSQGWIVEMRIPYSMLRFPEAVSQTWGIHFTRWIPRLGEQAEWPLVPRTERSNLIAQFGLLTGITNVTPRRNVQVRPYSVTRLHTEESFETPGKASREGSFDVGGDVKVGLGPNITLDATINPDFGQVESDPAELNLTAFETFFEERRPFFVEGIQIYQFSAGPGLLLYTRRVGAADPIVGAAKLSGRTARGLSFGLLGAVTGQDFDPARRYGVARMSQQIGRYSSAGGILTGFDAPVPGAGGRRQSVVGGVDWDVRLAGNRYGLEGFASVTHRRLTEDGGASETGFATKMWALKRQGTLTGFLGLDVFSDTFNPNDMGQLRENNFIALLNRLEYEANSGQSFGPFLRASAEAFSSQRFSYEDGRNLGLDIRTGSRWTLRGFQTIELEASVERPFGGYNLFETRGLGPWAAPAQIQVGGEFQTDERRAWQVEPDASLSFHEGGGRAYELGLRANWNVGTRLSLSGNLDAEWENNVVAWSSNETFRRAAEGGLWLIGGVSNAGPGTLDVGDFVAFDDQRRLDAILGFGLEDHYVPVFGARKTRSVDLTLRSNITFRPNLSLQLYGQFFLAHGRYHDFQILQNPDDLAPFSSFPKRDEFAFSSLQSNVVLRWEYRPGSTLFLVWTHGRNAEDVLNPLSPWGLSPYGRPINEQIAETFDIFPENVFLIKLNYTFLY